MRNKEIMNLLEMAIASPSSTAVSQGDFNKNQPITKNLANNVGSMDADKMNELVLGIVGDLYGGGAVKSGKGVMSILKNLFGKMKSKRKFPVGYGFPTPRKAHDNIDKLIVMNELSKVKPKGIRQFGKFNRQLQDK